MRRIKAALIFVALAALGLLAPSVSAQESLPTFFVDDATATEGAPGGPHNYLEFQVRMDRPSSEEVSFTYEPSSSGASDADFDWEGAHGTVRIPAGQTRSVIRVAVFGDHEYELQWPETFYLYFGLSPNAHRGSWEALGTILDNSPGIWAVTPSGDVHRTLGAVHYGGAQGLPLAAPIVGIEPHPSMRGYWLTATDGGVFTYGSTGYHGSMGGIPLNKPVVGMASTPSGNGYWLVAADGGIFSFGDAPFFGSMGAVPLVAPVVAMEATPDGRGYWMFAADGGVFSFGSAPFYGSMGGTPLAQPVTDGEITSDGGGYWMVAHDGGVFTFGNGIFYGSGAGGGGERQVGKIVGLAPVHGRGYWIVGWRMRTFPFGDIPVFAWLLNGQDQNIVPATAAAAKGYYSS